MNELIKKINTGEIDINMLESFFSSVLKGFIFKLNTTLRLRGVSIPHFILNTGDDILYLEHKGYDFNIEQTENKVTNEDYIYNMIPRCVLNPGGLTIPSDQLSSISSGVFQIEYEDMLVNIRSDFKRYPITLNCALKYYFDSFSDALLVSQQIISKEAFINNFNISYLGQRIFCSYAIPDSEEIEKNIEFDGLSIDSKNKTLSLEFEIETNYPVIIPQTVVPADAYIKETFIGTPIIDKDDNLQINEGIKIQE